MLIKDVIALLMKCNQNEELDVSFFENNTYSQCFLNNKVTVTCPYCNGEGRQVYELDTTEAHHGCTSSMEVDLVCHVCEGSGEVESEEEYYTIAEMDK